MYSGPDPNHEPDIQTCSNCGTVYDEALSDWSGPEHGHRDCITKLKQDKKNHIKWLEKLIADRKNSEPLDQQPTAVQNEKERTSREYHRGCTEGLEMALKNLKE